MTCLRICSFTLEPVMWVLKYLQYIARRTSKKIHCKDSAYYSDHDKKKSSDYHNSVHFVDALET